MNAETFNSCYPVGTPVFAYPGARPEDIPSTRRLITRTRTEAKSVGLDRDGVVWVDGHGAYISLTHVDVITEDEFKAARAAETAAAVAEQGALPMPVGSNSADLRARLFGFVEAGAEESDLPSFAAALTDYVTAELAAARQQIANDIHRAELPRFPADETPELVAKKVRAVDVRLAAQGSDAPYFVAKDGS